MEKTVLTAAMYLDMVRGGAARLNTNKKIVNELNVFPIPDGDTGDNMFMTINAGAKAINDAKGLSLTECATAISKGMLLGARGNSGVILSRIFAGIARGFFGIEDATMSQFGKALDYGISESYKAVSVPVEGTILTVYKDCVRYANSKLNDNSTLSTYFDDMSKELALSLKRTPDLLAVLKEAGVVDSGGAGLLYIVEGMQDVVEGRGIDEMEDAAETAEQKSVDLSGFDENSELEFGYCTEFLLQLQNSKVDAETFDVKILSDYLNSVGESVVCFKEGTVVKVHVHTKTPGDILNHCQIYGEYLTLKIENMTLQHHETTIRNGFEFKQAVQKPFGTVAVASGKGIKETFSSLGVDCVVEGGQSMNPSAEDFIEAFDKANAETIFVFPNNGNVILTARQAASLYEKSKVCVIPTKTIGEGYAALSMFDVSSGDVDVIRDELCEIAENVITGFVSKASRDTEKDGVNVIGGDYIGFSDDTIYVDSKSRTEALGVLAEKLNCGSYDVAILVIGEGTDEKETEEILNGLQKTYRRTEIISIQGDQPVFDYILILE